MEKTEKNNLTVNNFGISIITTNEEISNRENPDEEVIKKTVLFNKSSEIAPSPPKVEKDIEIYKILQSIVEEDNITYTQNTTDIVKSNILDLIDLKDDNALIIWDSILLKRLWAKSNQFSLMSGVVIEFNKNNIENPITINLTKLYFSSKFNAPLNPDIREKNIHNFILNTFCNFGYIIGAVEKEENIDYCVNNIISSVNENSLLRNKIDTWLKELNPSYTYGKNLSVIKKELINAFYNNIKILILTDLHHDKMQKILKFYANNLILNNNKEHNMIDIASLIVSIKEDKKEDKYYLSIYH